MRGTCTSAKLRGEFRDGWSGDAFCNAGPVYIRCGVVDFSGNILIWGSPDLVAETATWQDFLNPLGSTMGYDMMNPTMEAEEIICFMAPAGRPGETDPSVLDGQFVEIDITDQVNWILNHTGPNQGWYSGQYAIAFLGTPGIGSTGKIHLYADETASGSQLSYGSDAPWTIDGNTIHIVVSTDFSPYTLDASCYKPASDTSISRGDSLILEPRVNCYCPTSEFQYQWYLLGMKAGSEKTYLLRTDTLPIGTYTVTVIVSGSYIFDSASWKISVVAPGVEKAGRQCAVFNVAPNPFTTSAKISFSLTEQALATITVHDIQGRGVATLSQGVYDEGPHEAVFSARDLPAGVYVCRLTVGEKTFAKKMLLIR